MFKQADFHVIAFMFEQADFDVGLSLLEGQIKHQGGLISWEQNIFISSPNGLGAVQLISNLISSFPNEFCGLSHL